ncbi:hypothetical protein HGRIS_001284 [Hohenbuehelia grisea]|uniref:Uncharacterized protein n=1 Tax=Hohenbuehelia grisea TaxID=104357 RepID=A0ABR3JR26_9AGAR
MLSVPVSFRRRSPGFLVSTKKNVSDKAAQVEKVDFSGSTEAARVLPWLESGSVDEEQDNAHGIPVLVYLQRHSAPQGLPTPLANEGYTLNTPLIKEPDSNVSGNFNPIRINPYF